MGRGVACMRMNEGSVKLRKRKKAEAREAQRAAQADVMADAFAGGPAVEPIPGIDPAADDLEATAMNLTGSRDEVASEERAERAEASYAAAADGLDRFTQLAAAAEAGYVAAAERAEIAEASYRAAVERAEKAEATFTAAAQRAEIAEARFRTATERADQAEAKLTAATGRQDGSPGHAEAPGHAEITRARERAAVERDQIANARDRAAVERDQIANARDRAAVERGQIAGSPLPADPDGAAEAGDDTAVERARLEAQLQHAYLDALTGAFRREMGRLALRNEIDRARRADGSFVIAFIDVDGLKGVNDRDGHAAGDRVLRTLVATMRANLRSYDPIVRFGGDEFICGIGSIDPGEVRHRISVIDQSLRSATGVGITAGLASLTSNETIDELTARADEDLIEAKRNRGE